MRGFQVDQVSLGVFVRRTGRSVAIVLGVLGRLSKSGCSVLSYTLHPFCKLSCSFIAIFLMSISAFPWMLTGVEEERCLVRCGVHRVIVHKLCNGQPFLPIILEVVAINSEV